MNGAIAFCVLSALTELFFDADAAGIWLLLDITVDIMYALDMLLTFRTGRNQYGL